jgi:hypothetical protein
MIIAAASIAQTLVDKQVKFKILSYKLGLGKSLTGLGLKKFKKPWAWACPQKFSTPMVSSFDNTVGSIKQTFKTFSLTFI